MKKILLISLAVLTTAFVLQSCQMLVGSGSPVSKDFAFSNFDSIEADSAFALTITQGTTYGLNIVVDSNLTQAINVSQNGTTVHIGLNPGYSIIGAATLKGTITLPSLNSLSLSGACTATASGFSGSALNLSSNGACTVNISNTQVGSLIWSASGASTINAVNVQSTLINLIVSGASKVQFGLESSVGSANLQVSGASIAILPTVISLIGSCSGASTVTYAGNITPAISTSGFSTVSTR